MATTTSLLVIGAGPYALSAAACAGEHGIATVVVGRPMSFWREHMPEGMFLRSGPDWHLDTAGVHTLEAYLEQRAIAPAEVDPLPIKVFLDYAEWFRQAKGIQPVEDLVVDLTKPDDRFEAVLDSGERILADTVVAAPGIAHFTNRPAWADRVPPDRATHTCDLVRFQDLSGARVLIVGGRQSAYEWAALLADHGAERIDLVHRHEVPRFERVSWRFIDPHVESTLRVRGWWRNLPKADQDAITRRFWEVGRLTLEHWLTPRLPSQVVHRWPGTEVVTAAPASPDGAVGVRLSNGKDLTVDHVVFASGYKADLGRVPYLAGVRERVQLTDGFPALTKASVPACPACMFPASPPREISAPSSASSRPALLPPPLSSKTSSLEPERRFRTPRHGAASDTRPSPASALSASWCRNRSTKPVRSTVESSQVAAATA